MGERAVAVTGVGLVTPAGVGVHANWDRICSAESTARVDFDLGGLGPQLACRVPDFDATALLGARNARRLDRFVQFALVAARQAAADADLGLDDDSRPRVAVVMGCTVGGIGSMEAQFHRLAEAGPDSVSPLLLPMFLPNMLAAQIAIDLGTTGPSLVVSTACASGASAIGVARQLLLDGQCDIAIAGGSEAPLSPLLVAAFARMRVLSRRVDEPAGASRPFDADRDGFVMAEGAGVLVLERLADARARRARTRALLVGYGSSADAYHVTDPDPDGVAAERSIRVALADAGAVPAEVDHVNAHGTSTRLNDAAEAQVLRRVLPHGPSVTSTKGVIGHTLSAAGAVEAAYTALAVQYGLAPPTANLQRPDPSIDLDIVSGVPRRQPIGMAASLSFGFGGHNAALLFTAS